MSNFLESTDPDAFVDWVKRKPEDCYIKDSKECPVCRGFGGWNLTLNAYPLRDRPDTPENRRNFSHFTCSCSTCYGWGYVERNMNCAGHVWEFQQNLGRCYNRYVCTSCGLINDVDSSD